METEIEHADVGEDIPSESSGTSNASNKAQRKRKYSGKEPVEEVDFIVVKNEEDVQIGSEVTSECEEESGDVSAQQQGTSARRLSDSDVDMTEESDIPRERFFHNGKELDLEDMLDRMEHPRLKPGMKVVHEDRKRMKNNAKNALKQRKWRTMRGMVRQAEKLMKEIPTMEFLVVLSFDAGIKFAGTGSLLEQFKNGEPLTDGKPSGVSYTKESQEVVNSLGSPPCTELRTPEGTAAGDTTRELSDRCKKVRPQLIPEQRTPHIQDSDEDIDYESPECCTEQAKSEKRARRVTRAASRAADNLEEERTQRTRTSRGKVANPHQDTPPQETPITNSLLPGTFVYVTVATSSNRTVHAVAEVTQSEPLKVKYLRPGRTKGSWHFPDKDDMDTINADDIIKVLDAPQTRISGSRHYAEFLDLP